LWKTVYLIYRQLKPDRVRLSELDIRVDMACAATNYPSNTSTSSLKWFVAQKLFFVEKIELHHCYYNRAKIMF